MKCQTVKKGVVLTNQNMTSSLMACCVRACNLMGHERSPNEVYLAFLPLAHIFEITQEIIVLSLGIKVGYSSPSTLTDSSTGIVPGQLGDISVLKPTVMAAVPIILDRIYKALRCVLNNNGYKTSVWTIYFIGIFSEQRLDKKDQLLRNSSIMQLTIELYGRKEVLTPPC